MLPTTRNNPPVIPAEDLVVPAEAGTHTPTAPGLRPEQPIPTPSISPVIPATEPPSSLRQVTKTGSESGDRPIKGIQTPVNPSGTTTAAPGNTPYPGGLGDESPNVTPPPRRSGRPRLRSERVMLRQVTLHHARAHQTTHPPAAAESPLAERGHDVKKSYLASWPSVSESRARDA